MYKYIDGLIRMIVSSKNSDILKFNCIHYLDCCSLDLLWIFFCAYWRLFAWIVLQCFTRQVSKTSYIHQCLFRCSFVGSLFTSFSRTFSFEFWLDLSTGKASRTECCIIKMSFLSRRKVQKKKRNISKKNSRITQSVFFVLHKRKY